MFIRSLAVVVDDDSQIRTFIRTTLERDGFEVLEADGGVAALALVERLQGMVDAIVTDIQMPQGDGLTLAREVRCRFKQIPILLVSGRPQTDMSFDHLEKPFSSTELSAWVRRVRPPQARSA